jgi:hypothetical protein
MENISNKFYNYVLLDTRYPGEWKLYNNTTVYYKPFYVGKGQGCRVISHFKYNLKTDKNKFKVSTIKKIISETNNYPEYILLNENSENDYALTQEILIIQDLKDKYGNILTNLTDGGENPPTKFGSENWKARVVHKYDMKSGEFIESYLTIIEASIKNNISSSSHICQCCELKRKTCGNFIWRYEYIEEGLVVESKKYDRLQFKKLIAYNDIEELEFTSMKEAYSFLNTTNKGHINRAIKSKTLSYKGYRWKIIN